MAIASWSGPLRKYKETAVSMKEKEACVTIEGYIDSFIEKKLDKSTALTAIQLTLELCFKRHTNYRLFINSALKELEQSPANKETIISNLLKDCEEHSKK